MGQESFGPAKMFGRKSVREEFSPSAFIERRKTLAIDDSLESGGINESDMNEGKSLINVHKFPTKDASD